MIRLLFVFAAAWLVPLGAHPNVLSGEREAPSTALSLDTSVLTEAIGVNGVGIGVALEQAILEHVSVRLRHGAVEKIDGAKRFDFVTNGLQILGHVYSKGLQGWNLGLGVGYIAISITTNTAPTYRKLLPFVEALMGYKFYLFKRLLVEPMATMIMPLRSTDVAVTGINSSHVFLFGANIGIGW